MALTEAEELELIWLLEREAAEEVSPRFEEWRNYYRYKFAYGGRGAGSKSWSTASLLVQRADQIETKILCVREIQKSIEESSYELIKKTIERLWYKDWDFTKTHIINRRTGSKFSFGGIRDLKAAGQLKSYEGYDILFAEEAAPISKEAWRIILPTFRKPGSEIWGVFNREEELDPCFELFCSNPRPNSCILALKPGKIDNPWFTKELEDEMRVDYERDPDDAEHVWGGEPRKQGFKSIMSRALIRQSMDRVLEDSEGGFEVGIDVARFGDDDTEIYVRKGMRVVDHKTISKQDGVFIAKEAAAMVKHNPVVPIKVDATGVGASVVDQLKQLNMKVIPIDFGASAVDKDKYESIATEMWFDFPINEADIPDDPQLMRELAGRQYDYDKKSRRMVESKKKFKDRYGKSPDKADALILCFYTKKNILFDEKTRNDMKARRRR